MEITLTGILGWAFALLVNATALVIIVAGTYLLWSKFVIDGLLTPALKYSKAYIYVIGWAIYRKRFKAYYDEFRADVFAKHSSIVRLQIIHELSRSLRDLDASHELLATIGSTGDTLSDDEILEALRYYNEHGTVMGDVIAQVKID